MTPEEQVRAVLLQFYQGIEDMATGRGVERMRESWHHSPDVTCSYPVAGRWVYGWSDIDAAFEESSKFGRPENGGTKLEDVRITVHGDMAYSTGIFTTSPAYGGGDMNVTNVFVRRDGVWKMVHHHVDKVPAVEAKYMELAQEG